MSIIKVICDDLENNPECPHGPTLKFVRLLNNKQHVFYACSTYRDRKDCGFYLLEDDKITEGKKLAWALEKKRVLPSINYQDYRERLRRTVSLTTKERGYCHTCDILVPQTESAHHKGHELQIEVSNHLLAHPSQLFKPKSNSKQEAQYFFSTKTTKLITNNLQRLGIDRVLCVGTPRLHERIQEIDGTVQSLLLDFDHRYYNFYDGDKFCWFNMFNCHFLGENSKTAVKVLERFIGQGKIALVTDPPFGGRAEPLAYTINKLSQMCKQANPAAEDVLVLWVFPYFMEPQVLSAVPSLTMLDYRVAYDNHQQFQNNNKGRKHGSPVRIFTNIEPSRFPLPTDEGYRLCTICQRWISAQNRHCIECNACTSKDGQVYVHCNQCGKCVKPSWQHCAKCQHCTLPDHTCLTNQESKTDYKSDQEVSNKRPGLQRCFTAVKRKKN